MIAHDPVNILLVDDQPAKLLSYEAILGELGENLIKAGSGREALDQLLKKDIAVILIDVVMPDLDGFELATMIRDHPRFQKTSMIFVSAIAMTDLDRLRGYESGAVDYVPVPVVPDVLRAKVRVFAELYRKTRQLERLNIELEHRVEERTAQLAEANAELERRVEERTRELDAANQRLHQAQKLEAVGQLTGGVAHDFNNLLMAIAGNLDLLQRHVASEAGRRLIEAGHRAVRRGAQLTQSLLAFARRQILRPERVDVNRSIEEFSELLRRAAGDTVEVQLILSPQLAACRIDASQLLSALMNLVINSRDAMPPSGGKITVETENVTIGSGSPSSDPDVTPGDYVCVKVSDTGSGMAADVIARAFEPFFTTKEFGTGSGLGLSQVYGFAKQSGGHVELSSDVGVGTTVRLFLPRCEDGPTQVIDKANGGEVPTARATRPETILVVEDDAEVQMTVAENLRSLGYKVVTATDGVEALSQLKRGEQFDLLFSDIAMPNGMPGDELAKHAAQLCRGIRVLLTSGYARTQPGAAAVRGIPVLRKPYRQDELAHAVRAALDRDGAMPAGVPLHPGATIPPVSGLGSSLTQP
ncbi:MAG TPA: response regulator [Alphaproteobacteria bacterium]|nr:response regulator [Alphaproteobacteria bacterium]